MKKILTIGIPTWNRCAYLKKNLITLIEQIQTEQLHTIEIFISDNASDDGTEKLCTELVQLYPFISYHRQPTNLGANTNFQTVLTLAKGNFVWLFGDDDLIADNVITRLINDINQHQPDVVIGACLHDDSQQKFSLHSLNELICTHREFLFKNGLIETAGKMSSLIFKRDSIAPVLIKAENLIKQTRTAWPHLVWVILLLNDPQRKLLLLPYGTNQLVSDNWHNLLFTGVTLIKIHLVEYQKLVRALESLIDPDLYNQLLKQLTADRAPILFKCALYATYLDPYWPTLAFAATFLPTIIGFKNKMNYMLFLLLPLSIPKSVRKFFFFCMSRLPFKYSSKFHKTITRIKQAQAILQHNRGPLRQLFDEGRL